MILVNTCFVHLWYLLKSFQKGKVEIELIAQP
jgi:hypothetical protein